MSRRWSVRSWAAALKRDVVAVSIALRDPRTPWTARFLGGAVVAYALSPIDLIPDFIPLLGHLDDLVLLPLGLWLVIALIPPNVLAEARRRAGLGAGDGRGSRGAALFVVAFWAVMAAGIGWALFSLR